MAAFRQDVKKHMNSPEPVSWVLYVKFNPFVHQAWMKKFIESMKSVKLPASSDQKTVVWTFDPSMNRFWTRTTYGKLPMYDWVNKIEDANPAIEFHLTRDCDGERFLMKK